MTTHDSQIRNLLALAKAYRDAPEDTQDKDDAHNAFCEAAAKAMTTRQRHEWDCWCLKATSDEIVEDALRIVRTGHMEWLLKELLEFKADIFDGPQDPYGGLPNVKGVDAVSFLTSFRSRVRRALPA